MMAYAVLCDRIDAVAVVVARSANEARLRLLQQLHEVGYHVVGYLDITAKRAKEFDHLWDGDQRYSHCVGAFTKYYTLFSELPSWDTTGCLEGRRDYSARILYQSLGKGETIDAKTDGV